MKPFLKPLTTEEETAYLVAGRQGDTKAKELLIKHNLRLVAHIVKKYQSPQDELDDLISIGTIGLIKAVNTYDPDKGKRLGTYAAKCIENELLMYFRSRKKISREVSLYDPIGVDKEGNEISLLDIMESKQPSSFEVLAQKEDFQKALELIPLVLDDREKKVLSLRYGLDGKKELTQRETAKQLNISRSYVSRIEKTALQKLRFRFFSA